MRITALRAIAPPLARPGEHVPFDASNVAQAPASPGVYLLYRGHRLIYIGVAAITRRPPIRCRSTGSISTSTAK
jgi:hypothetical protein